jgi:hypothetical protein
VSVPDDTTLSVAVEARFGRVARLTRRPSPYASSAPLEDVRVELAGGGCLALVLKLGGLSSRPAVVHDPAREAALYRDVLSGAGLGTACCVATGEDGWLLLEAVAGVPLWQVSDVAAWCEAARWFARAHATLDHVRGIGLRRDMSWYEAWLDRAVMHDANLRRLTAVYRQAVGALLGSPQTFVHGEAYASNLIVRTSGQICPVDWEVAGCGPGVLDVAALIPGWDEPTTARIMAAYGPDPAMVDAARLVMAVQWLGWPERRASAPGSGTDWRTEAIQCAERLAS